LERILEHAGLEEGREFDRQPTYKTEQGQKFIPDVVIHYPDGRKMVVDSKVSLVAYYDWVHEENEDKKADHLKRHIAAIKNHIDGLSGKGYEKVVEGLDFVMLFMPLEPAYLAALQRDDQLWAYAYQKKIMLTGPSNLLISVKIVQDLWKRYDQSRNAFKIAEEAGKMMDKFIAFTQDMEKLGDRLRQSQEAYDLAMNKLTTGKGDLIGRIEKVHKLGASNKKSLSEIPAKLLKGE
jgi:DNA recombination protein RmuC